MNRLALCTAFLFAVIASTNAQDIWKTDKAHSQVNFSVSHMVFSEVTGTFKDFDAVLIWPDNDFTKATIEATIKAASIDTQNENRDRHVKSNDFLNVEQFPDIKFRSTEIKKTGENSYSIVGDLTIRDVTKSVKLDTRFRGTLTDSRGTTKAAFKGLTTIDRFEFGTMWDRKLETGQLVAGKDIDVTLLFEFNKQK